jgi:phage gpG-like protein
MFDIKVNLSDYFEFDKIAIKQAAEDALKTGMFDVERTSKYNYLSGPRPEKLGVVTGRLRNSILAKVTTTRSKIIGEIGTNVIYGRFHEEGTAKLPQRSFLGTAIEDNLANIEQLVLSNIDKAIEKGNP